jgi:hypothetical protein
VNRRDFEDFLAACLKDEEAFQRIMTAIPCRTDIDWNPLDKFIDGEKCELECPHCMLGCNRGAIWTARKHVREAVDSGATLVNQALVQEVLVENKKATGVIARTPRGQLTIEAKVTVLAAGGMATPVLLRRAGMSDAGQGLFVDPLIITYGNSKGPSSTRDIPMTTGTVEFASEGIVMTDLAYPWAFYLMNAYWKGWKYVPKILGYGSTIGIMTKVRDGLSGRVNPDGSVSKTITAEDRHTFAMWESTFVERQRMDIIAVDQDMLKFDWYRAALRRVPDAPPKPVSPYLAFGIAAGVTAVLALVCVPLAVPAGEPSTASVTVHATGQASARPDTMYVRLMAEAGADTAVEAR